MDSILGTVYVLVVTLCPLNSDQCYRTIEKQYISLEQCSIDMSLNLKEASISRHYVCVTEEQAQTLMASK
jgi:hypothetical protein